MKCVAPTYVVLPPPCAPLDWTTFPPAGRPPEPSVWAAPVPSPPSFPSPVVVSGGDIPYVIVVADVVVSSPTPAPGAASGVIKGLTFPSSSNMSRTIPSSFLIRAAMPLGDFCLTGLGA